MRISLSSCEEKLVRELGISRGGKPFSSLLGCLERDLIKYFEGRRVDFSRYPLEFEGYSPFSRKVWTQSRLIPYGEVRSYGWIAKRIGTKGFRAVGRALGRNPFPIIVPCHRVTREDGGLGGFSAGLETKKLLLRIEGTLRSQA